MTARWKLAVVDEDRRLVRTMAAALRKEGYQVQSAGALEAGLDLVHDWNPDVVLLEVRRPDADAPDVIGRFRGYTDAALIVVSSLGSVADRVAGLRAGADDYLAKPVALEELAARVEAVLRRHRSDGRDLMAAGDLVMDVGTASATLDGRTVALTAIELRILTALMRQRGKILSAQQLEDMIWPLDRSPSSNSVEVHVMRMRRKLNDRRPHSIIRTVRGIGYTIR